MNYKLNINLDNSNHSDQDKTYFINRDRSNSSSKCIVSPSCNEKNSTTVNTKKTQYSTGSLTDLSSSLLNKPVKTSHSSNILSKALNINTELTDFEKKVDSTITNCIIKGLTFEETYFHVNQIKAEGEKEKENEEDKGQN